MITELRTEYVYVALRRGTTGEKTRIEPETLGFLDRLSKHGAKLLAGFGISEPEQVRAIAPHVDAAVVGSAFVRAIAANDPSEVGSSVRALAAKLTGRS
jgi:tryptophan synthase alpha chain